MAAIISDCGLYRYRLERDGVGTGCTAVIMVNPSTADAENDDATIRKLIGFGQRNKWGKIVVGNLFAYRATDVRELALADDPVGPLNDAHLTEMMLEANQLFFAWGSLAKQPKHHRGRWRRVADLAKLARIGPMCLATTKDGHPGHPLMLGYSNQPQHWTKP